MQTLPGNGDTYTIVSNTLSPAIVGVKLIRIVPLTNHIVRTSCLRFELYGCPGDNLPLYYAMPDGFKDGRFGVLIDATYDGVKSGEYGYPSPYLSAGLGQLIDGVKGK